MSCYHFSTGLKAILLILAMIGFVQTAAAQTKPEKKEIQSLQFRHDVRPMAIRPNDPETYMGALITVDGKQYANGALVSSYCEDGHAYGMNFPILRVGDMVPLLNGVFRVESLSRGNMSVTRLPTERHKLPKEAKIGLGEYAFHLGKTGNGRLHGALFSSTYVPPKKEEDSAIKIYIYSQIPTRQEIPVKERTGQQIASVGDELRLGGIIYKVVNIVPPDENAQIIGWFEISKK